jgi:dienelactone hydrolase
MVKVYYPAREESAKPFSSYFHNSPELVRAFTKGYGMPDFVFDHLNLVQTNSKENLRLSDEQPSYPVILFSHGAGTTLEVQTSQGEDLASHGYIVAAIDHTYVSTATLFPDRIVSAREATTDFHTAEPAEVITQIMADDVRFVMDRLVEMNEGNFASPFKGKLDLNNIGVIGHSVGGAAAYNLAIHDSRVKAAVNLDGRVYVAPGSPGDLAPFLMLASDQFQGTLQERKSLLKKLEKLTDEEQSQMLLMYGSREAYQEAYEKDSRNVLRLIEVLEASGNLFTIEGSAHMKFIDIGLFIGDRRLRELMGIGGKTDPRKCLEITAAVTRAFFDQHLKGGDEDAWESLIAAYPELKKIDLK